MRALSIEARRIHAFAQTFAAAAQWLKQERSRRRWHDERERPAFLSEFEDRRLRHLVLPGSGRTKFM
jgi:hypothetical protein